MFRCCIVTIYSSTVDTLWHPTHCETDLIDFPRIKINCPSIGSCPTVGRISVQLVGGRPVTKHRSKIVHFLCFASFSATFFGDVVWPAWTVRDETLNLFFSFLLTKFNVIQLVHHRELFYLIVLKSQSYQKGYVKLVPAFVKFMVVDDSFLVSKDC